MKRLLLVLCLIVFGCYDNDYEDYEYTSNDRCEHYTDLCGDGGYDSYYLCCNEDTYNCWWEVNGKEYYTIEYMWSQECE